MPAPKRYTRRDFIGLTGLGALAGGMACITGITGYLLLRPPAETVRSQFSTATPNPQRPDRVKTIERPAIVPRAEWGARAPNHTAENEPGFYSLENVEGWREYAGDLRAIYRTVIVHHSVEYEQDDLTTVREIQNLHMDDRKWADIAYHFIVGKNGVVYEGRDLKARGTHVERYNTGSAGVVFLGDFRFEQPTPEQLNEGRLLINWLVLRLELTHLAGHYEFNDITVCPGPNMLAHLATFAAAAGLMLGTGGYAPPPEQLITPTPDA